MRGIMKGCSVEECDRRLKSKEYCRMHWERMKRRGTTEKHDPRYPTVEESLLTRVAWAGNCLEWTGARTTSGYGSLRVNRVVHYTHRLAWEIANGPIEAGRVIDHICRNRACLNLDHLRVVTHAENMQNLGAVSTVGRSGVRGVVWDKGMSKWQARIQVGGKSYFGGYFTDKEEAGRVAAEMRSKLMTHSQN